MRSVLSLLVLALPFVSASHQPNANHRELAKRAKGDLNKRSFSGARWTFYSTGLGACGQWNTDSDFIVAYNEASFGYSYPSKYCGKSITMTYNGKTTNAKIMDACPGCPSPGGLDLSPGLFSFFASQDAGVIYGTWWFDDDSDGGGDDTPTTTKTTHHTTPTTTHTTHTTPTTTYTPPPPPPTTSTTTTTKKSSTTTSSSTRSSSSASASPSPSTTSVNPSNTLGAASGTVSPTSTADPENLYTFAQALLGLTGFVVAGAAAE
ncbi:plant expansin [Mycena leptocephala]|nr:plant expansin [Mycena leptocephala]